MRCIYKLSIFMDFIQSRNGIERLSFARRPSDRGFIEDLDLYYKLLDSFFKGRLQSLLRMSVIVFAWGLHRKLGISVCTRPSLISDSNTRVVFFASKGVKLEVSKIY